jgi:hypothetical protein
MDLLVTSVYITACFCASLGFSGLSWRWKGHMRRIGTWWWSFLLGMNCQ